MLRPSAREACILVTLLLDSMGAGLIAPVLPDLLASIGRDGAGASAAIGLLSAAYAGTLFLFAPILGRLSDLFGRRPVLLTAMAGCLVANGLALFAQTFEHLLAARLVAGFCGASAAPAYAFITDIAPAERRPALFGLMGASLGLGFIIGPALGGWLGGIDLRAPFGAAALLAGFNLAFGWFALTESRVPTRGRRLGLQDLNPIAAFVSWRGLPLVPGMLAGLFLYGIGQSAVLVTWPLFGRVWLGWEPAEIGLSLAVLGLVWMLAQIALTPQVIRWLGAALALLLGLGTTALGYTLFGLSQAGWQVYLVMLAMAPAFVTGPAAQMLLSDAVPAERRGDLQGTMAALTSLATVIGSLAGAWVFGRLAKPGHDGAVPGAAFFLASLASLLALASASLALRGRWRPAREARLPPQPRLIAMGSSGGLRRAGSPEEADHVL